MTILLTLVAGYYILSDQDWAKLAKSAIATVFFVPNIQFWMDSGCFEPAAATRPLLHTWSLRVEEQFYVLWPFVILELARLGRIRMVIGCLLLAALSFGAAYVIQPLDSSAVFFLTPYRICPFAIGAIFALMTLKAGAILGSVLGSVAIAGLCALFFGLDARSGILPAMLASALLAGLFIWAAGTPAVRFLFAGAVFRWIGQRSYAIYLAHWPLMVFWLMTTDYKFSAIEGLAAIGASILLGAILHTGIEAPLRIRSHKTRISTAMKFLATGILFALVLGTSAWIYFGRSLPPVQPDPMSAAGSIADTQKQNCLMMQEHTVSDYTLEHQAD